MKFSKNGLGCGYIDSGHSPLALLTAASIARIQICIFRRTGYIDCAACSRYKIVRFANLHGRLQRTDRSKIRRYEKYDLAADRLGRRSSDCRNLCRGSARLELQ